MADGANAFLIETTRFESFAGIVDPSVYAPVPDDWVVGLSDVVGSTAAIAAGRYKAVNMAGAAVISAVSNAIGHGVFPFVFGGDGASFATPPGAAPAAADALAATATFVSEEFGLTLRVGTVPVRSIRAAGYDLRVARFAASPSVSYAMFSGGGLAWAEAQLKAGAIALPPAPAGTRPDLSGLSCRFEEIPASRGVILSMVVKPGPNGDEAAYGELIREILALAERSSGMSQPIPEGGPPLGWPTAGLDLEVRAQFRPGMWRPLQRLWLLGWRAFAFVILRLKLPVGGFNPTVYVADLVANSDYRKYDDGLRMTLDCAPDLADAIERRLDRAEADGVAAFGLHRQGAAIMTCYTPSVQKSDHIHFVDGAAGGYAAAAAALKRSPM